ncbi:very-long-chain (3R)-3-hydroxyacyl-CoA dehydratase hpo-8 [Belonocnema kinseyi]|uniref:very-long-chain (3R)-3-hydroxyacyl-CoA dehydratase hpo-8 n=1 Tax=Belonocnema kinseyi TaxID=2817044 RepID=UPI00143D9255|nr:very-long-chain (3R)-3-hydroxyacyl-CoA dehydratase hpo-8 [Belonocnema kinseyi]
MVNKSSKPKEIGFLAKLYLRSYNAIQTLGWSLILYLLVSYFAPGKREITLWETVKTAVLVFQNAAALEIVHAVTGLVPSNPIITTFQVLSRVMVVCGVLLATPPEFAAASPGLPLALFAWSVTEIIRYGYYFMNLMGYVPYFLVWLRYTTFIILYPIGITGELLCLYAAKIYATTKPQAWSYTLPNYWNFTFSYYYFIIFVMLLYIPLFPQLYLHMFAQRKKILGQASKPASKKFQ